MKRFKKWTSLAEGSVLYRIGGESAWFGVKVHFSFFFFPPVGFFLVFYLKLFSKVLKFGTDLFCNLDGILKRSLAADTKGNTSESHKKKYKAVEDTYLDR